MAFQNLFILGSTGQVGRELIKQITESDLNDKRHLNPTRIVGIANSKMFSLDPKGLEDASALTNEYRSHDEILKAVKES